MVLKKREDTEIERESIRCRSVNNLLWKRLWTCHKTDYRMMIYIANSKTIVGFREIFQSGKGFHRRKLSQSTDID
jgi:hypothetical protein